MMARQKDLEDENRRLKKMYAEERLRADYLRTFNTVADNLNDLPDAATVMASLPEWIEDYNRSHPHKGLKMKSP